jgi:predicted HicB family RNase H-like nuclease
MPPAKEKKEQISLRIKHRLRERAKKIAERKDIEMSEFVRQALLRAVELEERRSN